MYSGWGMSCDDLSKGFPSACRDLFSIDVMEDQSLMSENVFACEI